MRIDPHLQVEVVESTGEVITTHVKACLHWCANPGQTWVVHVRTQPDFGEFEFSQSTYVCELNWVETGFASLLPRAHVLEMLFKRSSAGERRTQPGSAPAIATQPWTASMNLTEADSHRSGFSVDAR